MKSDQNKHKFTIQTKMFLTVGLVVGVFIFILYALTILFLGHYSIWQHSKSLADAYNTLSEEIAANNGYLTDNIKTFESVSGMKISFLTEDYESINTFDVEDDNSIHPSFDREQGNINYENIILNHQAELEEQDYFIYTQNDPFSNNNFLTLIGDIPLNFNNYYMVLQISVPAIESNIKNTRFFIFVAGAITFIIAMIIAFIMARHFVRPIVSINNITKSMTKLDFSKHFEGEQNDEIGELGQNINLLSDKLEASIKELRETNARLEEDVRKEKQIDEMRQNLIANVSHDLKTPIAIIQGYAEGLQANISSTQEDRDFYTTVIIEESERMNKLVRQILNLSQLELGKIKPEIENIEIKSFVDVIINKFTLMFKDKGIEIGNEIAEQEILADSNMLSQVLVNLITNAADHTDTGHKITISAEDRDTKLRIKIFNEGENIPEDELDKLWLSFYKRDKARTVKYGGTGIGLTIVKTITEAHNNKCGVYNNENGVTFWFESDKVL